MPRILPIVKTGEQLQRKFARIKKEREGYGEKFIELSSVKGIKRNQSLIDTYSNLIDKHNAFLDALNWMRGK